MTDGMGLDLERKTLIALPAENTRSGFLMINPHLGLSPSFASQALPGVAYSDT